MSVQVFTELAGLPDRLARFIDDAAQENFFTGIPWFRTMLRTASPPGDEPRIYVSERDGRIVAALVMSERRAAGRLKTHMLVSPTPALYVSWYGPIVDPTLGAAGLKEIAAAIADASPPFHVLRLDNLDSSAPTFAALGDAFHSAGFLVQTFFQFHNWYDQVEGLTIDGYLAARSSQTRYHIGRRVRQMERSGRGRFELITGGPGLEAAYADYHRVDRQSWKKPEPYPACLPEILRVAADEGALRLGLYYIDNEPAAAQIWLVRGGIASIERLHYAEKFAKLSVGTVLSYEMFRYVLENDKVREIDFGRGDDEYKRKWMGRRRQRGGMLVFNARTKKGAIAAARHFGGHAVSQVARRTAVSLLRLVGAR